MGQAHATTTAVREDGKVVQACDVEILTDPRYIGSREIWPSSLVLAYAIKSEIVHVKNKVVLELGAGLGLPSIVAETMGAKKVFVSDRVELGPIFGVNKNRLQLKVCEYKELDWLEYKDEDVPDDCDLIIGADIVYFEEQDALIGILDRLLKNNKERVFVLAYKERTDLDRAFVNEMLDRYHCERNYVQSSIELYWLRAK